MIRAILVCTALPLCAMDDRGNQSNNPYLYPWHENHSVEFSKHFHGLPFLGHLTSSELVLGLELMAASLTNENAQKVKALENALRIKASIPTIIAYDGRTTRNASEQKKAS